MGKSLLVSVHGVKNIIHYDELERQLFHPFLSKPNRLCRFCERLVIVTPDLLRKSTPEGLFAKQFRVDKGFNPPERLRLLGVLMFLFATYLSVSLSVFLSVQEAHASELTSGDTFQESQYVCASVWACDERGKILEEYRIPDDPCYQHYVLQCESVRAEYRENKLRDLLKEAKKKIRKLKARIARK